MKKICIEIGHSLDEWEQRFGDSEELWDVSIDDLENGSLDPSVCKYWLINGRLYETNIMVW